MQDTTSLYFSAILNIEYWDFKEFIDSFYYQWFYTFIFNNFLFPLQPYEFYAFKNIIFGRIHGLHQTAKGPLRDITLEPWKNLSLTILLTTIFPQEPISASVRAC